MQDASALMLLVTLLACTQAVPPTSTVAVHDGAPPAKETIVGAPAADDPSVASILVRSCYPCHSDERRDPWYAKLAPSSWSTSGARAALNFSAWTHYDDERRARGAALAVAFVEAGSMPPADYAFFNRAARLSDADKRALARWGTPPPP